MMSLTLIISKTMMSTIITMMTMIYMNIIYKNSSILLIYLILYAIYLATSLFIMNYFNSLLILMTLIVFLSGMLIMFSYFISLSNEPLKLKTNLTFQFFSILIMSSKLVNVMIKDTKIHLMPMKNIDIMNLYTEMNYALFLLMIFMLIVTLMLMTKITYIEKKTLRKKK
uniref:NADH dehydrogenase subunit 5 n=1 Tax=Apis koschevnikovi TaxID=7468 RepID=A0A1V0D8Q2_APIKO|nr:NADH dehydrogenase subunit 5 [Apis koschevnikovi]BAW89013.1 NADH dehydrogenase subunit 6 [Apis koschevnikovi]